MGARVVDGGGERGACSRCGARRADGRRVCAGCGELIDRAGWAEAVAPLRSRGAFVANLVVGVLATAAGVLWVSPGSMLFLAFVASIAFWQMAMFVWEFEVWFYEASTVGWGPGWVLLCAVVVVAGCVVVW